MDKVPVRVPTTAGVKTTFAVQVDPAATDVQLLVWLKSPLIVIPVIASVAVPVFEMVTVCAAELLPMAWLAKVRVAGVRLTAGAIPVPVKATVCRPPVVLSAMDKVPVRVPTTAGVKTTFAVQVAPAATDVQLLVWLKSPLIVIPVIVSVAVPVFEMVTICGAELLPTLRLAKVRVAGARLTTGAVAAPVPVKPTFCGLPVALSATDKVPVRVPAAVGVKTTFAVQVAPAATDVQLLVWLKSPPFVPVILIPVIVSVAVPVFEMVTVCAAELLPTAVWFAKVRVAGVMLTTGARPLPVKATVCGLPVALSATDKVPPRVPEAVGVKTTFAVQLAPAATDVQLLVWLKSPPFVPVILIPVIVSAAPPVFEIVTVCAVELLPMGWLAKVRVVGVMLTAGAVPVPVKATVCRAPVVLSAMDKVPVRVPAAAGVKTTFAVQAAPAATDVQLLVWLKSPLIVIPVIVSVAVPVFEIVTVSAAELLPMAWPTKVRVDGATLTAGAGAVVLPQPAINTAKAINRNEAMHLLLRVVPLLESQAATGYTALSKLMLSLCIVMWILI
jgi:hypothetical protein